MKRKVVGHLQEGEFERSMWIQQWDKIGREVLGW